MKFKPKLLPKFTGERRNFSLKFLASLNPGRVMIEIFYLNWTLLQLRLRFWYMQITSVSSVYFLSPAFSKKTKALVRFTVTENCDWTIFAVTKIPEHCHRKKCFLMVQLISLKTVYYLSCVVFLNAKNAKKN